MGLKKVKPTSPGRRFQTYADFAEVTKKSPERSLLQPLSKSGGRNCYGRVTAWQRGGGHKRHYRVIDFKRDKIGVPARGCGDRVRPQPVGPHRAAALCRWRKALHPGAG